MTDVSSAALPSEELATWAAGYCAGYDTGRHAGYQDGRLDGYACLNAELVTALSQALGGDDYGQAVSRHHAQTDRRARRQEAP